MDSTAHAQPGKRRAGVRLARRFHHELFTWSCERKFGISTCGLLQPPDLGVSNPDAIGYSALEYEHILWALPAIPFPPAEVVFIDYGAGKGRALAAAAAQPFREVIGVEISESLVAIARRNLARMKHRRAAGVEIHHADAALFSVPAAANVFFFFNPFTGATLGEVVRRMHQSWKSYPRDLFVIFFNHGAFDQCIQSHPWLRKVHDTSFCGLYRTV